MLLSEVKGILRITWDDEDKNLRGIIERGQHYIEDLTETKLEFESNNQAKSLLLNYCRYDYNSALEYFEDNFLKEIIRLQLKEGVKDVRQKEEDAGLESGL